MKIAYLLGSLNRGGAETLLLDVCRNARSNELDAFVIHRKSGVLEREFLETGVPMFKVPVGSNKFGYLFKLRKILIDNQIDIVHAQQPLDAMFARLASVGTKLQIVLTFHGYDFHVKGFGHQVLAKIIKRTYKNVYVSDNQRKHYQQKYRLDSSKQEVVYNGISFDKLNMADYGATITLRNEFKLSSETLILATVGNFVPGRDQFTLCRFIKRLYDEKVNFHFFFIGKKADYAPQFYDDCIHFCEANNLGDVVSFLGSRSDVPQLLPQLDAFIYSTHHDTFGIAVVEAMAVGIPVFVNDWGVMNEITDNGKYATIYKTGDENDLLREFMLFLQSKTDYVIKANYAAAFVRERYSIEKHIQNLKLVYSK